MSKYSESLTNLVQSYFNKSLDYGIDQLLNLDFSSEEKGVVVYLAGLMALKRQNHSQAEHYFASAHDLCPEIAHYDYRHELLKQCGCTSDLELLESNLNEHMSFAQTDAFIISYPKCGRTWLRMLTGHYLLAGESGDPLDVFNITLLKPELPTIEFSHDDYPMWKPFDKLCENKDIYNHKKIVYLYRDPRDVIVSYYFHTVNRSDQKKYNDNFNGTLEEFVMHDIGGLPSIVKFYNYWAEARRQGLAYLSLSYEELKDSDREAFLKVIDYLELPHYGDKQLQDTLEFCSFRNMHRLEENNEFQNPRLAAPENGCIEGYKVRRGIVGGYRNYLRPEAIDKMNDYISVNLDDIYECYK